MTWREKDPERSWVKNGISPDGEMWALGLCIPEQRASGPQFLTAGQTGSKLRDMWYRLHYGRQDQRLPRLSSGCKRASHQGWKAHMEGGSAPLKVPFVDSDLRTSQTSFKAFILCNKPQKPWYNPKNGCNLSPISLARMGLKQKIELRRKTIFLIHLRL